MSGVRRWITRTLVVAAAAGAMVPAARASAAEESSVEATYLRYHKAVHAAERCRDRTFGTPEHSRMAAYVDERAGDGLSAGRQLQLIEDAKREVDRLVHAHGCGGDVAESLALFDTELAPLLAQ